MATAKTSKRIVSTVELTQAQHDWLLRLLTEEAAELEAIVETARANGEDTTTGEELATLHDIRNQLC